jgi:MYXO-CTERM domain-containing protein
LQSFLNRGAINSQGKLTSASLAAAITANKYYQLIAAPTSGNAMSLSSLSVVLFQQNTHTSATADLQYSLDGFATAGVDLGSVSPIHDGWTGSAQNWDLSGVSALQNASNSVTFRVYCYGFAGYEDQGLGQIPGNNNDVLLSGTVGLVPEPAAMGSLALCGLAVLRRRRAKA